MRRPIAIAAACALLIALAFVAWEIPGARNEFRGVPVDSRVGLYTLFADASAQGREVRSEGWAGDPEGAIARDSTLTVTVRFSDSRPPLIVEAYRRGGAYYLSDIALSAALGISVKWDPLFRFVTLAGRKGEATAVVGGTAALVDGSPLNVPHPFLEEPGRLLVPVSFLGLGLPSLSGFSVSWNEESAELSTSAMEPSVRGVTLGGRPDLARITVSTGRPLAYRVLEEQGELSLAVKGAVADSAFSVQGSAMSPVRACDAQWNGDELVLKLSLADDARSFQTFREKYPQAIVLLVSSTLYREGFDLEPLAGRYRRWGRARTVVLDPAHGGDDWGAVGSDGLKEKDAVLQICLRAASILRDRLGVEVYLTRDSDYRVPAAGRAETANSRGADVFVSVHCDSWPGGGRQGYGACVLPPAATEGGYWSPEAKRISEIEGRDPESGPTLRPWRRLQGRYRNESRRLAQAVLKEIAVVDGGPSHGVREIEMVSLVGVDAPAICVQCGFLDNRQDLDLLGNRDGRDKLAAALARGIEEYIDGL